tara:strand:- start:517 stop:921 length:405 start_codon:yes stop_codon:yes gene_type:complete
MNIFIIHGPNLNLLGLWSSKNNSSRLTLDKVNQKIRKYIRGENISIKILQSNSEEKIVSHIQKNRKKIDSIIITPGPLQNSGYVLSELLELLEIPFVTVSYNKTDKVNLLNGIKNFNDKDILSSYFKAIDELVK